MKKLFLFMGAFAIATSVSLAQNTSTTSQTGTDNSVTVSQIGEDNKSTIKQNGSMNLGNVQQGGFGDGNIQSNNATAFIDQVGSKNNGTISQRQGAPSGTELSYHRIEQNGRDNFSRLTSYDGGNSGYVDQDGIRNDAKGNQTNSGHYLKIAQTGNDNEALVDQLGGFDNSSYVIQKGNENNAKTWQRGEMNFARVEQDGIGNLATQVTQDGTFNNLNILQDGNSNTSILNQLGDNHKGTVDILGDGNTTILNQSGMGNISTQNIMGNGNVSLITQN